MDTCMMGHESLMVGTWRSLVLPCAHITTEQADRLYPLTRCARTGDMPRGHLRCRERGGRALYPGDVGWPDRRPAAHKVPCMAV